MFGAGWSRSISGSSGPGRGTMVPTQSLARKADCQDDSAIGWARTVSARIHPAIAQTTEGTNRTEALLLKTDSVRLQNRAGLALQVGKLHVVPRECAGFEADGVPQSVMA